MKQQADNLAYQLFLEASRSASKKAMQTRNLADLEKARRCLDIATSETRYPTAGKTQEQILDELARSVDESLTPEKSIEPKLFQD